MKPYTEMIKDGERMAKLEIKPDVPIEVTKDQYKAIKENLSGAVAFREDKGKFYIKVWSMECANLVKFLIVKN
jgi:hypothetical protein